MASFKSFSGINNLDDHIRVPPRDGSVSLSTALNVDIDKTGKTSRRDGKEKKATGDFRSIWSNGSMILTVKDGNLVSINPNTFGEAVLKLNVGTERMSYAEIGSKVYFSNGTVIGYVEEGQAYNLLEPTVEFKRIMPPGTLVAFKGHLLSSKGNLLYFSDAASYDRYDGRKGVVQFKGDVTMMAPVNDGLFVSDDAGTYFMRGSNPEKWIKERVADYGAKSHAVKIPGMTLGDYAVQSPVMWISRKGFCVGGDNGFFRNLTEKKYGLPDVRECSGAYITRDGLNQFIGAIRA